MPLSSSEPQITELKQQAIHWLVRLRSDDLSDGEMYAFADWLSQDHTHSETFAAAENLFNDMVLVAKTHAADVAPQNEANEIQKKLSLIKNHRGSHAPSPSDATQARLLAQTRISSHLRKVRPAQSYTRWLAYPLALAAAWLFAVILVLPQQSHWLDDYLSDYHTNTGELREIQLADGSHILLNTNSAVSVSFKTSIRQITLHHGQARFTVAKDTQRPFEVLSDGLIVRALGTIFEVYNPDSSEISVTVQEHAVAARIQADEQHLANVQIGQRLRYRPGSILQHPESVDLNQATAWQQHQLFINDRPLSELIAELDRYRVGRIFLADDKLKNLRVTGVFSLDKPADVLNSIRKVLALQETRLGPWWILLHR